MYLLLEAEVLGAVLCDMWQEAEVKLKGAVLYDILQDVCVAGSKS